MKKFIIVALLAVTPFVTFAQREFDKFQDKEGIDGIVIHENLVDVLGYIKLSGGAEKAKDYLDKVDSMESLRVFTTSDKKYSKDMKKTVASYLRKHSMDELVSLNDKGTKVNIYITAGKNNSQIKELLVFTENKKDDEVVLVSFIGNIDLDDKE
ncbi:DUF4252 domain-containing protein [Flavobacterium arcticum]|uniref:DUF4252 domain-containing protein n=1 Tax=Flavobacterium arcticum TaxID=1784713 RepID=A0A345HEU8_9FLAO|nr:DUF4252 domain-containing protein [Flavobacterium arcticum]AXG75108.1 DUF4252 domain-containing protein [Flavobacterium arcticum]KAF2511112.1 DUF4252 domain-containing protein [Flavobacterium arcticum]